MDNLKGLEYFFIRVDNNLELITAVLTALAAKGYHDLNKYPVKSYADAIYHLEIMHLGYIPESAEANDDPKSFCMQIMWDESDMVKRGLYPTLTLDQVFFGNLPHNKHYNKETA